MTFHERFMNVLQFKPVDGVPNMEWGMMNGTKIMEQWHREGMPEGISYVDYFGICHMKGAGGGTFNPMPGVPGQGVIHEDETHKVIRDCWGREIQWNKKDIQAENARRHLRDGIVDRSDWNRIRGHFKSDHPIRKFEFLEEGAPPYWPLSHMHPSKPLSNGRAQAWEDLKNGLMKDWPIQVTGPSMMGELREVMGFERYCMMLYDDCDLVEEIMEVRTHLAMELFEQWFDEVQFDILHFWEDIAFNGGSMLSPSLFEKIAVPRYKRIIDLYKSKGGEIVSIDSDGDIRELIPGWLKAGINHFWPIEVKANMDVVSLRKEYGHDMSMRGGINKMVLFNGKEAIDRELDRIAPVVQDGGYIPCLDHQMPTGAPFDNVCYYFELKRKLLGITNQVETAMGA